MTVQWGAVMSNYRLHGDADMIKALGEEKPWKEPSDGAVPPQDEDVHCNHLDHSWPLHLDGHLLTVGGQDRPVDLSQGGGGHRLEGDLREYRADGLP